MTDVTSCIRFGKFYYESTINFLFVCKLSGLYTYRKKEMLLSVFAFLFVIIAILNELICLNVLWKLIRNSFFTQFQIKMDTLGNNAIFLASCHY